MKKQIAAAAVALAATVTGIAATHDTASATNIGTEGCTPGYWKNHTDRWEEYTPKTPISNIGRGADHPAWLFPAALASFRDMTMLQALNAKGGTSTAGAAEILVRAGAAAWLNAANEGVGFPYRRFATGLDGREPMDKMVNGALLSGDRSRMLSVAKTLDDANNLGCPMGGTSATKG